MVTGYALIFGGGGAIGRETGFIFAERGSAGVMFADIDEIAAQTSATESQKLASHEQYRALELKVDVTDRSSVEKVVAAGLADFGRIDYCVNSAGVGAGLTKSLREMPTEEFDRVHNVNARGTFFILSEVSKVMLEQTENFVQGRAGKRSVGRGSIVNIASLNGRVPVSGHVQYGSSKYAAIGITETAASELARKAVRVNSVLPSWVDTQMMATEFKRLPDLPENIKALAPTGRMAFPEEVAEAVHFLCSPGASYIHGIGLAVDSGLSLTRGLA